MPCCRCVLRYLLCGLRLSKSCSKPLPAAGQATTKSLRADDIRLPLPGRVGRQHTGDIFRRLENGEDNSSTGTKQSAAKGL